MELAPSRLRGRLPGFQRASPSTPLDASSYVWRECSKPPGGRKGAAEHTVSPHPVTLPPARCRRYGEHTGPRAARARAAPRRDAGGIRAGIPHDEEAHADHRQPVCHHGLRPPAPSRRVRAAGPLRGRRRGHRGARSRHRALPRGRSARLRRGRRLRRRRHRQRSRQRPARLPHPAHLPARRLGERVRQDARHPRRARRRHRAPAGDGR